jgi:hypothetical protein
VAPTNMLSQLLLYVSLETHGHVGQLS